MTKVQENIWNELITKGEFTPRWKPGHEAQSLEAATSICEALCQELGGQKKVIRCCGTQVDNWVIGDKVIGIFHTYNFTSHGVEENSEHFIIHLWTK